MKRSTDGFTLVELLIALVVLGILLSIAGINIFSAKNRADDAVAQGYVHEVSQGIESKRVGSSFTLPPTQTCASLVDKSSDPESVRSCTYTPGRYDAYSVSVESRAGTIFRYDGIEIEELP